MEAERNIVTAEKARCLDGAFIMRVGIMDSGSWKFEDNIR